MRLHHDERGQTILLVALSLPIMLGFIGMATDVGALFKDKRTIQTAADAAAIAAALNLNYGTYVASGKSAASANGFPDGGNVTVQINDPPTWPGSNYLSAASGSYVEATITKTESTIFLALFGYPSVTVTARAVATNQGSGSGCIYTTGATGTTFRTNGNVTVNAPTCGVVVESDDSNAMVVNGASANITLGSIGVVGGYNGPPPPEVSPAPTTNIAPDSDPLNYLPQYTFGSSGGGNGNGKGNGKGGGTTTYTVSCASGYDCTNSPVSVPTTCSSTGAGVYNVAAGSTLYPGCYVGLTFPSSGVVTVEPGLYLVDGDLTFGSGNVNGSGVTFYYSGQLTFTSGTYNLAAPNETWQLFNGILFAESIGDTNSISFGGNSNTVIKGIVYAPDTDFTMSGTPSITLDADFVVKSITLSGNVTFTSYGALSGIKSPLTSIALVE